MLLSCADRVSISKAESVVNTKSDWGLFYVQKRRVDNQLLCNVSPHVYIRFCEVAGVAFPFQKGIVHVYVGEFVVARVASRTTLVEFRHLGKKYFRLSQYALFLFLHQKDLGN